MASLSDDLILEIISRLPLESGIRCKCLNKSFNKLIPNPKFLQSHGLLPKRNRFFRLASIVGIYNCCEMISLDSSYTERCEMISLDPSYTKRTEYADNVFFIMSSTNSGRLFLRVFGTGFCLFNPVTEAYIVIRDPPSFDVQILGFVDDLFSPHYKVVGIHDTGRGVGLQDGRLLRICIFESNHNSWRQRTYEMDAPHRIMYGADYKSRPVSVNGCLHWLVHDRISRSPFALVFDANNEVPFMIKGPDSLGNCCIVLGDGAGSSVAIAAAYDGGELGKFSIYVIDLVEEKWQFQQVIEDAVPRERKPVYVDGDLLICLTWDLAHGHDVQAHVYRMREKLWEKGRDLATHDKKRCLYPFVPSLASIPGCSYLPCDEEIYDKKLESNMLVSLSNLRSLLVSELRRNKFSALTSLFGTSQTLPFRSSYFFPFY